MKKYLIILLGLVLLGNVFAEDLTLINVNLTSSETNASLNFGRAVNVSYFYLDEDQVTLYNFTFNESENFYYNDEIINNISVFNWTQSNTNIDSSDFLHYFRFWDNDNSQWLLNYTFGNYYSEVQNLTVFFTEFGIESNKTWTFDLFGYPFLNFTFPFSFGDHNEQTYNLTQSEINIFIYDIETNNLLIQNVTIELVGPYATTMTTINGTLQYRSFNLFGDYTLTASTSGYDTENYYFTFSNQEQKNISIYMINSTNSEQFTFQVTGPFSDNIQGATVKALKWNGATSQYELVVMDNTDSTGLATLNLIPETVHYVITAELGNRFESLDSKTYTSEDAEDVIPITLPLEAEGITYTQIELGNIVGNITSGLSTTAPNTSAYFELTYNDPDEVATKHCVKVYTYRGMYLNQLDFDENTDCSASATGVIVKTFDYQNGTNYMAKYYVTTNNKEYFVNYNVFDTESGLAYNSFVGLIVIGLVVFGIYLGYAGKFMELSIIATDLIMWLVHWAGWFATGPYGTELLTGFTLMCIVGIWGVNKLK